MWEGPRPLLPEKPPKPKGGRAPYRERAALTRILFVLKSAIPWEMLPKRRWGAPLQNCCGTAQGRHQAAGVWDRLHERMEELDRLGQADEIDGRERPGPGERCRRRGPKDRPPRRIKVNGAPAQLLWSTDRDSARGDPLGGKRPRLECLERSWVLSSRSAGSSAVHAASEEAARRQGIRLPTLYDGSGSTKPKGQLLFDALLIEAHDPAGLTILITGTPVCTVLRTISRAASGSRSMLPP